MALSFDAQERHTYRVRVREIIYDSDTFRVWVEDSASGETVGEKQTGDQAQRMSLCAPKDIDQ